MPEVATKTTVFRTQCVSLCIKITLNVQKNYFNVYMCAEMITKFKDVQFQKSVIVSSDPISPCSIEMTCALSYDA